MSKTVRIILKNDDTHTIPEVMEFLSELDLEYHEAKEIVRLVQENGEHEIIRTTFEEAFFVLEDILQKYGFDYELLLV